MDARIEREMTERAEAALQNLKPYVGTVQVTDGNGNWVEKSSLKTGEVHGSSEAENNSRVHTGT